MLKLCPIRTEGWDVIVTTRSAVPSLAGTVLGFHMFALSHCLAPLEGLASQVHVAAGERRGTTAHRVRAVAQARRLRICPFFAYTELPLLKIRHSRTEI